MSLPRILAVIFTVLAFVMGLRDGVGLLRATRL